MVPVWMCPLFIAFAGQDVPRVDLIRANVLCCNGPGNNLVGVNRVFFQDIAVQLAHVCGYQVADVVELVDDGILSPGKNQTLDRQCPGVDLVG